MDHAAVLELFDRDMREGARPDGPGAVVERAGGVVRQAGSEQGWNGVLWSRLSGLAEADVDAVITEQVRYFAGLGRDFEWKLYGHDRPADLGRRLRAAGFTPEPEETLMIAECGELSLDAEPPEGIELRPVTDRAGVDLMVDVHEQAFGTDSSRLRHQLLAQLDADPDTVVAVVALAGDVPVSSTAWSSRRGPGSRACGAAAPSRPGVAAASTAHSSPTGPASPPPAATATSRSTPPTRAAPSSTDSASQR